MNFFAKSEGASFRVRVRVRVRLGRSTDVFLFLQTFCVYFSVEATEFIGRPSSQIITLIPATEIIG